MSRYRSGTAYNFGLQRIAEDHWRTFWTVDRYYVGVRMRFPRGGHRDTDLAGAIRFAKKHNLATPKETEK